MAEYIDGYIKRKDALLICDKAYKERLRMADYCGDTVAWNIAGDIKLLPIVDVAPVRHGRWIWADDGYCRCSECAQKAPVVLQYQDEPETVATNYCPNCGAKMDGEEGET